MRLKHALSPNVKNTRIKFRMTDRLTGFLIFSMVFQYKRVDYRVDVMRCDIYTMICKRFDEDNKIIQLLHGPSKAFRETREIIAINYYLLESLGQTGLGYLIFVPEIRNDLYFSKCLLPSRYSILFNLSSIYYARHVQTDIENTQL